MNLTMVRGSTPSQLRLFILQSIVVPVHEKTLTARSLETFQLVSFVSQWGTRMANGSMIRSQRGRCESRISFNRHKSRQQNVVSGAK